MVLCSLKRLLGSSAGDDYLFKGILLGLVTVLVGVCPLFYAANRNLWMFLFQACKEHSSVLGGIVVPLLRESMSPGVCCEAPIILPFSVD